MSDLTDRIKKVRARTAAEFPNLIRLAIACQTEIRKQKPSYIRVTHRGETYLLQKTKIRRVLRTTRPIRVDLFLTNPKTLKAISSKVLRGPWDGKDAEQFERLIYTIQQSIGLYLDFFNPTAARKVVGTFFESVMACVLNRISGLEVGSGTIKIPNSTVSIRTDLGVRRKRTLVLLAATKTSTRERLSQPFVQKYLVDKTLDHPPKTILTVVGDVQRIRKEGVQHTFTAGQFQLYWDYLTKMDGVYYMDIPPQAKGEDFQNRVKPLSQLLSTDYRQLFK